MALFRVQVFYERGLTGKWTNVWHTDAADIIAADNAFATVMEPLLLAMLDSSCNLVKYLVSDPATDAFVIDPRNEAGTSTGSGDLLPLFNSAKVYFDPAGFGRPDYKFFKGFVTESLQTNGVLQSTAQTYIDTQCSDMVTDMAANSTPLVADDGSQYSAVSVQPNVQMRQMHRRRKKVTPTP